MMDAGRHPNITLMTNSVVQSVSGSAGDFSVTVLRKARYVDEAECTACGDCSRVCPVVAPHEFEEGLALRRAIYSYFAQAVPAAYIRNPNNCLGTNPIACGKCAEICKKQCIDLDMPDHSVEIPVGSIIVATGIDYYDPREASEYGYTRYENVVNSIELERILSASGPTHGQLIRFTDRKPPKRVSFVQCVGSRCLNRDIPYCSRICCMNAMKSALLIHELLPDAKIDIFYIDVRAFGKGFEQFYHRARTEAGVNFIKGKPSHIEEDSKTGNLIVFAENVTTGKTETIETEMVILSEAVVPAAESVSLGNILGIKNDHRGFFSPFDSCGDPIRSSRDGIFLVGCSSGPKDITDSIAEASGAAIRAAQFVGGHKLPEQKEELPDYDYSGPPRVGVYVCHCGSNIAGVVDVELLKDYARTLPDVVFADDLLFACADSTQRHIQQTIREHHINRVVIAACTPRTHEPIFRESIRKIGLNPYLLEMGNIRDHCSWVHTSQPAEATRKASDIIRMAVAKARLLEPLQARQMEVGHNVLVIGGGITGIETALQLAKRDYHVYLVEKEQQLGGQTRALHSLYPSGMSGDELIEQKLAELRKYRIDLFTGANVTSITGYVGNFEVELALKNETKKLAIGAIAVATGFDLYKPGKGEFGYQKYANVITNMELESMLQASEEINTNGQDIQHVTFIQCVGSRGPEGIPECSRYCCQAAIKQAIVLREKGIHVTILNRDIRVYHREAETMYRQAREAGVIFIRYTPDNPPKIIGDKWVTAVEIKDSSLDEVLRLPTHMLVLSVGMRPAAKTREHLQQFLKLPVGMDGFFLERHPKFGPVETNMEGVYIAGCAQGPKDIADSIAQANAVAAKIDALLARPTIWMEPITSVVQTQLCRGCGTCVEVCEYGALQVVEQNGRAVAIVNEALCKGCGTCATFCPTSAIDIRHFRDKQIESMLEAFLLPE